MRGINLLRPDVQKIAIEFVKRCQAKGLNVAIGETWRNQVEQNALFAKRPKVTNAQYPNSYHCWGIAFDFFRNEKGREWYNGDGLFQKCAVIGKDLGLRWGGDFKTLKGDYGHLEMPEDIKVLQKKYSTPLKYAASWEGVKEVAEEKTNEPSAWAKEAWQKATAKKIIDGTNPQGTLTREQLIAILDRLGIIK